MAKKDRVYLFSEILLDESKAPASIQVLRVGKFKHPEYGKFEITPKMLTEFKQNFDAKVRGIDIAFDYFHDNHKIAAAWPKGLELRENGTELWATDVEWTPRAAKMLSDKELRYFSPEFYLSWTDPESGEKFSNVLFGGGLTNRPFIKEMEPLVSLAENDIQKCVSDLIPQLIAQGHDQEQAIAIAYSKCGEKKMSDKSKQYLESTKGEGLKMDEKDKMIADLQAKVAELEKALEAAKGGQGEMMGEMKKLQDAKKCAEEKIALMEKEAEFVVMLTEGKVCAAQKEAFLKGDMKAFAENAKPVNLEGKGSGASGDTESFEDKVLKLAEKKMQENKNLSNGDAISAAMDELKK